MKKFAIIPLLALLILFAVSVAQPSESDFSDHRVTRVEVVVATESIDEGTSATEALSSGALEVMEIESDFRPDDAVPASYLDDRSFTSGVEEGDIATSDVLG